MAKVKALAVLLSMIIFLQCECEAKPDNASASDSLIAEVQNNTDSNGNPYITPINFGFCFEPCVCTISTHRKRKDSHIGCGIGARVLYYGDYGVNVGAVYGTSQDLRTYIAIDRMLVTQEKMPKSVPFIKKVSAGIAYSDGKRIGIVLSTFF